MKPGYYARTSTLNPLSGHCIDSSSFLTKARLRLRTGANIRTSQYLCSLWFYYFFMWPPLLNCYELWVNWWSPSFVQQIFHDPLGYLAEQDREVLCRASRSRRHQSWARSGVQGHPRLHEFKVILDVTRDPNWKMKKGKRTKTSDIKNGREFVWL